MLHDIKKPKSRSFGLHKWQQNHLLVHGSACLRHWMLLGILHDFIIQFLQIFGIPAK